MNNISVYWAGMLALSNLIVIPPAIYTRCSMPFALYPMLYALYALRRTQEPNGELTNLKDANVNISRKSPIALKTFLQDWQCLMNGL